MRPQGKPGPPARVLCALGWKARQPRILGVFEGGATQPCGTGSSALNYTRSAPDQRAINGFMRTRALVSRPSGSWRKYRARRPDRKARRASVQAVCERGATPRGGMPRPGIMSRTTGTGRLEARRDRAAPRPKITMHPS